MKERNDIERLFKTHYRKMHQLAMALLHDDDSARDIVHDVFASLLLSNSDTDPSPGYLLSSVRNRCLNSIRDTDIHDRITNLYFLEMKEYDSEDWPDEETIDRIYRIIKDGLPEQCRRVMELRFESGLTFSKVAKELGISENAVYKHFRHALTIIRKNLNQNG